MIILARNKVLAHEKLLELRHTSTPPNTMRVFLVGQEERLRGYNLENEPIVVAGDPCPELDRLVETARAHRGTVPDYPWPAREDAA